MRPDVLNRGYKPATKLLFATIRLFSGRSLPDAAKLVFYRPDFYGNPAKRFTHLAMRGPSAWSVADRELMAAVVSLANDASKTVDEVRQAREQLENLNRRSPIEVVLDGLTHRRGAHRREG